MKRREFVVASSLALSATFVKAEPKKEQLPWLIIDEVFEILFPKTKTMPSAKQFNATGYLQEASKSK